LMASNGRELSSSEWSRRCVFPFLLFLDFTDDCFCSQVKMSEPWDAQVSHATKPPVCLTAGGALKPVNESKDWTLFNWKYSSASSFFLLFVYFDG
jgi:hypothetical protein